MAWFLLPVHAFPSAYKLQPGDVLDISVWREDALQRQVLVLPDGSITFPLAGPMRAAGLSAAELEARVTAKLAPFIPEPSVTVMVTGIDGNRVYVIGHVINPGAYVLSAPATVLQILSLAGGLDRFADEKHIRVLRTSGKTAHFIEFNYRELLSGRKADANIRLQAGDVILVP